MYIHRNVYDSVSSCLSRNKSVLLLGPRQAGKTTFVKKFNHQLYLNLMNAALRNRYERDPAAFIAEVEYLAKQSNIKPLIIIDEIQKVPGILDSIQILIDENIAQFILTGSSARKLKNLLPGRVIKIEFQPISIGELLIQDYVLESFLMNGMLPEIINLKDHEQSIIEQELTSYVSLYLEEEIRKEALVRNLGAFGNFLKLACIESGNIINVSNMAQEVNVARNTITEYYNILSECMLVHKIEPITETTSRRKLQKAPKYIMFDLGIRRIGAQEGIKPGIKVLAHWFEQFVLIELYKFILSKQKKINIHFWRDHAGPEVDIVLEAQGKYTPIEVKWTELPSQKDARHLKKFMDEYPIKENAYIICRTPKPLQICKNIIALPWQNILDVIGDDE